MSQAVDRRDRIGIADLNALPEADFVRRLGGIFEHAPWVAQAAAGVRPYHDVETLHAAMMAIVRARPANEKLALLRAHPRLASRSRRQKALTSESRTEQRHAGLDEIDENRAALLDELNAAYLQKFGFPFIIVARENTVDSILAALQRRLENNGDEELAEALDQIAAIARIRLREQIVED
jgi:2-oxo-4-hydroxy-4-carboxy-5-ureidoimidazoline decarboxylase